MGDMDSGNSGSIQSSSTGGGCGGGGDDQEFDSCRGGGTESISMFLNSYNHINMDSNIATPTQLYSFSNGSSSFAPNHVGVSNYFSSLECPSFINHGINNNNNNNNNNRSNSNNNNQLDMGWPNKFPSIRPISTNDTNCTTEGPLGYTITNNHQQQSPTTLPLPAQGPPAPSLGSSPRSGLGKNPKKRSRTSRRAPTTVLTTDTTNFRQMVQEFTGIPAPPFTAYSPRTRFDLFSGLGVHSSNSSIVVQPPSYLLRPFPQKIAPLHQPRFLGNTPTNDSNSNSNNNNNVINNTNSVIMNDTLGLAAVSTNTVASTSSVLSPTTFHFDPQDYLSSTNPQLNFQSFLQSSTSASSSASASALGLNDKYSLPALVQQDSSMSRGCTSATNSRAQISCSVNPASESGSYLGINTTTTNSVVTNGALDNIGSVTRGSEGMVDSWICSSD